MRPFREVADRVRRARGRNLTYRQLPAMWRGRKEYLRIAKNFRKLEGSWPRGIRKLMSIILP